MNLNFDFFNPARLIFGNGKLKELKNYQMPGKKAMLLISNGNSTKINGLFDSVIKQMNEKDIEVAVFDKIMENPLKK